jgi:hypothetical protein
MTPVEPLLRRVLNDEWDAQSARSAPFEPTAPVLAALDLVLAGRPMGIFSAGRVAGGTPDEIVAELRDELPAELSPWTRRTLERVAALRVPAPPLPSGPELPALPPADEPLAISDADVPELPPPAPSPAPEPARQRPRAATARLVLVSAPLAVAALALAIRGGAL